MFHDDLGKKSGRVFIYRKGYEDIEGIYREVMQSDLTEGQSLSGACVYQLGG